MLSSKSKTKVLVADSKNSNSEKAGPSVGGEHPSRSARARWGNSKTLFDGGFLVVPHKFLQWYAWLRPELTTGEAMFVLHLMTYKWEAAAPYPSYRTLARRMNVSETMVRSYARSLSQKGYLIRQYRSRAPNRFDLTPLFEALDKTWGNPGASPGAGELQEEGLRAVDVMERTSDDPRREAFSTRPL